MGRLVQTKMYKNNPATNRKKSAKTGPKWLVMSVLCLLLIAVLAIFVFELTNTTHLFHSEKPKIPSVSAGQTTKGVPQSATQSENGTQNAKSTGSQTSTDSGATPAAIVVVTPYGEFVSNHHPNLSGSPAPNTITSVCTTTAGVSCKIMFTNASTGVVKSLPAQVTDAGGTTYWGWKLQDVGLGAGTWHIQAIASSGTQTKTASDPMDLVVAP